MVSTDELQVKHIFDVSGYVCLVTGGGTGIGLMASQALASNGAKAYITGRRMEVLEEAAKAHQPSQGKGEIIPIGPCDVTSKEDLEKLATEIGKREPHLDLLITNAGISGAKASPDSSSADDLKAKLWSNETFSNWNSVFQTDVAAVYFTTVAFLPLLQRGTRNDSSGRHLSASVIVISSMSGIMRDAQGHFSYNAAKGATVHLSKLMSAEFQKANIRVNSIAPGYFPSEMTVGESERGKSDMPLEQIRDKGHVPADRPGSDEEMAQAVLFLARNRYVAGEVIAVDGGVLNVVAGR